MMKIETVGEYIALARRFSKKTLRQIEQETGVSNAVISQYENGHTEPGLANLVKLSKALNFSIDQMIKDLNL